MTGDWAAVARAINQRMAELDIDQTELIKRSRLAKQTVSEIQNDSRRRNRSPRTLEAISTALGWNPGYLAAVLEGRTPPAPDEPHPRSADDVPGRLDVIEYRLDAVVEQLRQEIEASLDERFGDLKKEILAGFQQIVVRLRQSGR